MAKTPTEDAGRRTVTRGVLALEEAAECLKTLGHPVRLRMVQLLLEGRYTVGELAEECGVPDNVASEHLRLMRRCGLFASESAGRKVYYRVEGPHLSGLMRLIEAKFFDQRSEE